MSETNNEYPKWVVPHESLIVKQGDNVVVPEFDECHVNRVTREVTVLVKDVDEEKRATTEKQVGADTSPINDQQNDESKGS